MRRNSTAAAAETRQPEYAHDQPVAKKSCKQTTISAMFLASASKVSLATTVSTATTASDAAQAMPEISCAISSE